VKLVDPNPQTAPATVEADDAADAGRQESA
jgi:hypothetical protein